ncbi:MAG: hypothetical protein ACKN9T_05270, partial [Candidatus Methylumidiphilus sp.]
MNDVVLSPPETLTLTPPEPVKPVAAEQASAMVKLNGDTLLMLDNKVKGFVEAVVQLDAKSPEFVSKVNSIHALGSNEIRAAANISNRMLDRPVA